MFEVFLSYNAFDSEAVTSLALTLQELGFAVWLDKWAIVPGRRWQQAIIEGVSDSECVAVFVGPNGIGPWESAEMMVALDRAFKDQHFRVIPVLLPGAPPPGQLQLPQFLSLFSWVDFRDGLGQIEPLRRLIAGIRGKSPGAPESVHLGIRLDNASAGTSPSLARRYAQSVQLLRCFGALGFPPAEIARFHESLLRRCDDSLASGAPVWDDFESNLEMLGVQPHTLRQIVAFVTEWLNFLFGPRLIRSAFYASKDKIARAQKSYRPALEAHFRKRGLALNVDTIEERFVSLHRFFLETANLVFLPARSLLFGNLAWGSDPIFYFAGTFMVDFDDDLLAAFPSLKASLVDGTNKTPIHLGVVNEVFQHPDPFLSPFMSLSGRIGHSTARMTLSRKYINVTSGSVDELCDLLSGSPKVISGLGSIDHRDTATYVLQPLACHFSTDLSWLNPLPPGVLS